MSWELLLLDDRVVSSTGKYEVLRVVNKSFIIRGKLGLQR